MTMNSLRESSSGSKNNSRSPIMMHNTNVLVVPFMPTKTQRKQQQQQPPRVNPLTDSVESLTIKLSTLQQASKGHHHQRRSSSSNPKKTSKSSTGSSAASSKENLEQLLLSWRTSSQAKNNDRSTSSSGQENAAGNMPRSRSYEIILDPESPSSSSSSSPSFVSPLTPNRLQRSASDKKLNSTTSPLWEHSLNASLSSSQSPKSPMSSSRFILPARQQQQHQNQMLLNTEKGGLMGKSKLIMAASTGAQRTSSASSPSLPTSPQHHLEDLLQARGYDPSTMERRALDTAFYCRPTDYQKASYGSVVVQAVRSGHSRQLRELLKHLSANPCTPRGESLWHMVCRCGSVKLLKVLMQHEDAPKFCQVVSQFGRSVLHEACWASQPALELVQLLLDSNPLLLFLYDGRGTLPLSYIPSHQWTVWKDFLDTHADAWFPSAGPTWQYQQALEWLHAPPNSKPWKEPAALPVSLQVASMIASGQTNVLLEMMELEGGGGGGGGGEEPDYRAATEPIPDDIVPVVDCDEVVSDFEDLDSQALGDEEEDSSLFSSSRELSKEAEDINSGIHNVDDLNFHSDAKIILEGTSTNKMVDYIQQFPFRP